ncbi:MAG TPA: NAD-dependent protein deacylase [Candidatus Coprosoma intestinipullorum]|uniref:NAD-dependent protein deacetylase n=1 Tax=Candidatus Coprosoma intestinipullorum TaxID=2840752 RepID=A0A9D0ZQ04_9FIRM|nr:NAD-dependent protein deacylase [Candidatus Coprosoma intestinipullorum]
MEIEKLQEIIDKSNNIVFFGGAGVSTESGIPDFRSKDGLYHMKYKFPPEEILSHSFFMDNLDEFYRFYKDKMNSLNVLPNVSHKFLAKLEKAGKLRAVITQNIDGLHTKAGSKNVLELHGTIYKNHCMECGREYSAEYVFNSEGVTYCECGGIIKPDVVLYEEALNDFTMMQAINYIKQADVLIVAGTSLTVYPASGLIRYFRGKHLVIINRDTTDYDNMAELVIHEKLGDVFGKLKIN